MSRPARPEPGVSYAGGEPAFQAQAHGEAIRSLADWLGTTEHRAAGLLEDGDAATEIRNRRTVTGRQAMRELERRFAGPWLPRS